MEYNRHRIKTGAQLYREGKAIQHIAQDNAKKLQIEGGKNKRRQNFAQPKDRRKTRALIAKHIGLGVIDGMKCEHLAFRNHDTDWQLWVETGDRPIPRKLVITSKTMNSAPQYTIRIKSWKSGVDATSEAFTFEVPAGAEKLDPNALIHLDELPLDTPEGGSQR